MKKAFIKFVLASVSVVALGVNASPWIGTLDPRLHQDLVTLVEYDVIGANTLTYPVPWRGIGNQLEQIDWRTQPTTVQNAATRLLHYYHQSKRSEWQQYSRLAASSDEPNTASFDGIEDVQFRLSHTTALQSDRWAGALQVNLEKSGERHLDGSYIAFHTGEWVLRAGALDQHWGPAHGSSLIVSTNARPVPTVGVYRAQATQSESAWLNWLGPWYASAEIGQLEAQRAVPDARLWRARFSAKPFSGLSIGASWVAMWGGEGQPGSFSDLIDILTFSEECATASGQCTDEFITKRGNHLAGFDVKYTFNALGRPISLYAQRIGEDAASSFNITDNANLVGVSSYVFDGRLYLEHSDTNINCVSATSTLTDCYYEHSIYQSGYRYRGRAMGSTFDSDATQTTLGWQQHRASGATLVTELTYANLNQDGSKPSPVLTKGNQEKLWLVHGYYQRPFGDWLVKLGGSLAQRKLPTENSTDAMAYFDVRYVWE